jgi:DNA-binding response OmpR family regulator
MRRIILTGLADAEHTMSAINSGRVHRYLTKPWPTDDLIAVVTEESSSNRDRSAVLTVSAGLFGPQWSINPAINVVPPHRNGSDTGSSLRYYPVRYP